MTSLNSAVVVNLALYVTCTSYAGLVRGGFPSVIGRQDLVWLFFAS